METIGLILLTLVGLLLIFLLLMFIPAELGQKAGIWVASRLVPSQPQGRQGEPPSSKKLSDRWWWWAVPTFIAFSTTPIVFESLVPGAPRLLGAPYLIFTSLQEQRLQEDPVHLIIYGIILATAFFIVAFIANFLSSWYRFAKKKRSGSDPASEKAYLDS